LLGGGSVVDGFQIHIAAVLELKKKRGQKSTRQMSRKGGRGLSLIQVMKKAGGIEMDLRPVGAI